MELEDANATPSDTSSEDIKRKSTPTRPTGMDRVKKTWEELPNEGKYAIVGIPLFILGIILGALIGCNFGGDTVGGSAAELSAANTCNYGGELVVKPGGDYNFTSDPKTYKDYVDRLKIYLEPYIGQSGENVIDCSDGVKPSESQVCRFDISLFGDCTPDTNFGFQFGSPCFVLAFNMTRQDPSCKQPTIYTQVAELPKDMPLGLKRLIESKKDADDNIPKRLWVYCTNADAYFPRAEYRDYYLKNTNVTGDLLPLVAVRFHAQQKKNTDIISECRVWAEDGEKRSGKVDLKVHMSD